MVTVPLTQHSRLSPRSRAVVAALGSAFLTLPLGWYLAEAEHYQWIGKGGRGAYPTFGTAFFPKAALFAFAAPYLVLALLLLARASFAGAAAITLGNVGRIGGALLLLLPLGPYFTPVVVWVLAAVYDWLVLRSGSPVLTIAILIVGLPAFFVAQFQLVRQGRALEGPSDRASSGRSAAPLVVVLLLIGYIWAWGESLAAPDAAADRRVRARRRAIAIAAAAERAKLPRGTPLELIRASDASPGRPPSNYDTPARPAVDRAGNVYLAFRTGLVSLDRAGRLRWRADSVRSVGAAPTLEPDSGPARTVYVGGADGRLYAVRASDGTVAWAIPLVPAGQRYQRVATPVRLRGGDLLAGAITYDPRVPVPLFRLGPDGALRWRASAGGGLETAAGVGPDEAVYGIGRQTDSLHGDFGAYTLSAIAADGRILWRRPLGVSYASEVARAEDGTIFVAGTPSLVLTSDGTTVARLDAAASVIPVADLGLLEVASWGLRYLRSDSSRLRWSPQWTYPAARIGDDERVQGAMLAPGGRVILSTSSRVVVLRLGDGQPIGEYAPVSRAGDDGIPIPQLRQLSPPALGPDGTIFVVDPGYRLYWLRDTASNVR